MAEPERAPRSRGGVIAWTVVLLCAAAFVVRLTRAEYDSSYFDSGTYVATARALAAGEGYAYLGQPFLLRPPGLSVLLVPLIGVDPLFPTLNYLGTVSAALAGVLLFALVRRRLGDALAVAVALTFLANPYVQQLANRVLSDVPGTALMLGVLLLERRVRARPSRGGHVLLALALAGTAYVRLVYVLLVPAILAARLFDRSRSEGPEPGTLRRDLLWIALVPALLLAPWKVRNTLVAPPPPSEQTANYSYSTATWHTDPGDPGSERLPMGEVAARVPERLERIAAGLGSRLLAGETSESRDVWLGGLALAALAVAFLRHREAGELAALAMVGTFSIAHAMDLRLVVPMYALALPAVAELVAVAIGRLASPSVGRGVATVLVLGLAVLDGQVTAPTGDRVTRRHNELARVARTVEREIPADAKLAAWDGVHLAVYLDRPVVGLEVVGRSERRGGLDRALELIEEQAVDFVVIQEGRRSGALRPSFRDEVTQGPRVALVGRLRERYKVVSEVGPYLVLRTR